MSTASRPRSLPEQSSGDLPRADGEDMGGTRVVSGTRRRLAGLARGGVRLFVGVVPALLGAGLWGALKGMFLFGAFGALMAGVFALSPRFTGGAPIPPWLLFTSFVVTPLSLALAGGYVLMLQGVGDRLAREVQSRGLMGYVYAVIKPAALQVAQRLRGKGRLGRAELVQAIEQSVVERLRQPASEREEAPSRMEWLEQFLMEQSHRVLGLVALRSVLTAPDVPSAIESLETLAIDRLEGALVETLEDLYFVQRLLALGLGVVLAAVPTLLLLFMR
ncbi:hypothetical protein LZ198_28705 [Myxococcus sp. K15C18031901]|uniref:hypothetical protein n=1 Tax=Myxococcus dinghuensis TaxID=2906761 RepID=UPI0020A754D5|nr:hypothetical protein [Myxococcus dinghuensis]MCP3102865.1 hypothetical protein [Myxococcus dinghuensis]